ncbi:cortical protein marker for cell polarity-domain-containing protein [Infundibulicybe gibba]|nr:cortical protein marker for cell polarity-domain-containing protein [Infundibulicybe gibba]
MFSQHPLHHLLLLTCFLVNGVFAALPQVDFNRMGKVGLAGAFAGLDLFQNSSSTVTFDSSTSTLLSRSVQGTLTRLAATNPGGRISAGCALGNVFYFGGVFTSIAGNPATNVASYTPSSGAFSPLGSGGPNGEVNAIFCDSKDNKVWVGGSFSSPGSAVAVWDVKASSWSKPPFGGVSGAQGKVLSITTNSSNSGIFFAGSFVSSFQGGSITNGTNNPNVPFSTGATPFSSSLVPIPLQGAQIEGSPSSSDSQFSAINNILCPAGPDGPGNTWLAADGSTAVINVRTFTFISANGIRLGNTFQSNHGTTRFSLATIPDNGVQTLKYIDPTTGQNQTCSDECPLSTDSSILYQDFLFENTLSITGVQIKLSQFTGSGSGLHILQLLSSGAFASSIESNNVQSCFAPNPSNTTRTGDWSVKQVNTDIPGTVQSVLVSSVDVGTPASSGPTFTWIPYVSASGDYDINLLIPGCTEFQDCPLRTSVKVTVFPGENLQPWVTHVLQQNQTDAMALIYSGPILPSSPNLVTTISMSLDDSPAGQGQDGKYMIVADRVQLVLKSATISSNGSAGSPLGSQGGQTSFGFLEWPRSSTQTVDGTKGFPNTTQTALDGAGIQIFNAMGSAVASSSTAITSVVHHSSGSIFLGGNFSLSSGTASGSSNIVAFKSGSLAGMASNGLNGPITSLVSNGDQLFVGGAFTTNAASGSQSQLSNIAMYDIQKNTWIAMGAGLNGQVTSLGLSNGQVQVAGNFTKILATLSGSPGIDAAGLATWDIKKGAWVNSGGFVVGSMSFVGNSTGTAQVLAGNVVASHKFGASGLVMLDNGDKDGPGVTPLGAQLEGSVSTPVSASKKRRHISRATTWISSAGLSRMFSRQSSATQLAPLPAPLSAPAPAVLAGTFWTNGSSEVAIIGGNFSFAASGSAAGSPESQGVAIYDPTTATIRNLQGSQVNGTVRAVLVDGSQLYVGGAFTVEGTNVNGLAIYDLAKQQWDISALSPLQGSPGSAVVVRSITKSPSKANTIIVAGSFALAGLLQCQAICAFDTSAKQWNALGNGILGEISSIAYAGVETLIAAGSIALPGNTPANVAQFGFANATWAAVGQGGDLPGPVTAVEVNSGNPSSIFAAGRASDGSTFLSFWNGVKWAIQGSTLQRDTTVSQLTMVPLQDTHAANGVIESDRMLLVSGTLADSSFGNASSALFDGQSFIPYIVSTSPSGTAGAVASLFHSIANFSFQQHHFLATGVVILISIAIAAGVVFLLALIGILWTLFSRRDDKLNKFEATEDNDDDSTHHRPSSLLEHINAATRTTILGTSPFGGNLSSEKGEKTGRDTTSPTPEQDPFGPDASNYMRAETPSDAVGGLMAEETSRPAYARYSFDGTGEGELPLSAGADVEVLDDRDPAWWYARDVRTGREGVVPAAYLY